MKGKLEVIHFRNRRNTAGVTMGNYTTGSMSVMAMLRQPSTGR